MPDAEQAVAFHVRIGLPRLAFGATWAFACGAAAGLGGGDGLILTAARLVAGWFVAAPLFSAVWAALLVALGGHEPPGSVGPASDALPGTRVRGRAAEVAHALFDGRYAEALVILSLTFAVAVLLGEGVLVVLAVGIAAGVVARLARGRPPAAGRAARSVLAIVVPGLVGWLAAGGPVPVAAPVLVVGGGLAAAVAWAEANWLVPAITAAFAVVHLGMAAVDGPLAGARGRAGIWLGYGAAVALLAFAGRPLGAGAVALAFIAQWPLFALLGGPDERRAGGAAASGAMLAMLAALVAAR